MQAVNSKTSVILARFADLVGPTTPWNRSLWSVGTTFTIAELLDACSPPQAQTLSDASQKNILEACRREIGNDPVIEPKERAQLGQHLAKLPHPSGSVYPGLKELRARIESDYLLRWAKLFDADASQVRAERAARSIATHLLDMGFSDTYLSRWFKHKAMSIVDQAGLARLCEIAHDELATVGETTYSMLFLFRTPMVGDIQLLQNWLASSREVADWLRRHRFSTSGVRAPAGLRVDVKARDKFSALEKGSAAIDNYVARASMATGKRLEPLSQVWIAQDPESPLEFSARSRGVKVGVLHRQAKIFVDTDNTNVDAIEHRIMPRC